MSLNNHILSFWMVKFMNHMQNFSFFNLIIYLKAALISIFTIWGKTTSDTHLTCKVDMSKMLAHGATLSLHWSPVCVHLMNLSPLFTVLVALVWSPLPPHKSFWLSSCYMFHILHKSLVTFVCLSFGAGHVARSGSIRACLLKTTLMRAGRPNHQWTCHETQRRAEDNFQQIQNHQWHHSHYISFIVNFKYSATLRLREKEIQQKYTLKRRDTQRWEGNVWTRVTHWERETERERQLDRYAWEKKIISVGASQCTHTHTPPHTHPPTHTHTHMHTHSPLPQVLSI